MTNLEKLKILVDHLQFMIDEDLVDEEHCGSIAEEVMSTMEILSDCNVECEEAFKEDLKMFAKLGGDTQ